MLMYARHLPIGDPAVPAIAYLKGVIPTLWGGSYYKMQCALASCNKQAGLLCLPH